MEHECEQAGIFCKDYFSLSSFLNDLVTYLFSIKQVFSFRYTLFTLTILPGIISQVWSSSGSCEQRCQDGDGENFIAVIATMDYLRPLAQKQPVPVRLWKAYITSSLLFRYMITAMLFVKYVYAFPDDLS